MATTTDELISRLQRIHAAIGATVEHDMSKFCVQIQGRNMSLNFRGDMSQEDILNFAWSAIHNTSTMYNHLQDWAADDDSLKDEIKAVSKNSKSLQILRTLDNKDKHPKARNPDSEETLSLVEVSRSARLRSSGQVSGFFMRPDGTLKTEGDVSVVIDAIVVNDKTDDRIGSLSEFLGDAIQTWENFMQSKGMLSP